MSHVYFCTSHLSSFCTFRTVHCSVSVHSTVDCTALQVVCLPFRAKPCYAKVPRHQTGSEEVPIAFKFLAQWGGCRCKKVSRKGAETFLPSTLLQVFFPSRDRPPRPGNQILLLLLMTMLTLMMMLIADTDDDAELRVMKT